MRRPAWIGPARAERWRKPVIVAVSVLGHAALLFGLGLRSMGLTAPDLLQHDPAPVIYVQIEPRPLLPGETPRTTPPPPVLTAPVPARPSATMPDRPLRDPTDQDDGPSPLAPHIGPSVPGAPAPPAGAGWAVRPETLGDRVVRHGRTGAVGCASPDLLTAAERAICDDRFGARAALAAPIEGTGNPGRDTRFAREGARRLAEWEARRRPLSGGVGVVGPQDGPGSNFGMGVAGAHLDPSLRPDSTTNIRTRRDGSRATDAPLTPGDGVPRDQP